MVLTWQCPKYLSKNGYRGLQIIFIVELVCNIYESLRVWLFLSCLFTASHSRQLNNSNGFSSLLQMPWINGPDSHGVHRSPRSCEFGLDSLGIQVIPIINLEVSVRLEFLLQSGLVGGHHKFLLWISSPVWCECYQHDLWHFTTVGRLPLEIDDSPSVKKVMRIRWWATNVTYLELAFSMEFFISSQVSSLSPTFSTTISDLSSLHL